MFGLLVQQSNKNNLVHFYIFCEVVVPKGNKVIRTKLIKYLYQVIFVLLSVTKTNLLT